MRPFTLAATATIGAVAAALTPSVALAADNGASVGHGRAARISHVLVISVDGLHQSDLEAYVKTHPKSAMAQLTAHATTFTDARTTFPSDSFPGTIAQFTGAGPGTTGVYYDDTYSRGLLPPGTTDCTTAKPGTEVAWTEGVDKSQKPLMLDAGQGIPALKQLTTNTRAQTLANADAITKAALTMTGEPGSLLDPKRLPVDPKTCTPVLPHQVMRVNTAFEVAAKRGLLTAWSDKHPAYEILNGPSGTGIKDLFAPEIDSVADAAGDSWTTDNALTREYDSIKVAAVLNEIRGYDHSGAAKAGVPALFGMNFQAVSTAQKLPTSDGLKGGYNPDGTPGPLLSKALDYVDSQLMTMGKELRARHLEGSTQIVLSAKHGQTPVDPASLRRVDDGAIVDAINAGWKKTHPGNKGLIGFGVNDDLMMLWLSDRSAAAQAYVKGYLMRHSAPANTISDAKGIFSTSVPSSGLTSVHTGKDARALFGARAGDPNVPDVVGIARPGVVYTGGVKKIAEHGGAGDDDRNVALLVGTLTGKARTVATPVSTKQIAPTILASLGLTPTSLKGVRADHTRPLPDVVGRRGHH